MQTEIILSTEKANNAADNNANNNITIDEKNYDKFVIACTDLNNSKNTILFDPKGFSDLFFSLLFSIPEDHMNASTYTMMDGLIKDRPEIIEEKIKEAMQKGILTISDVSKIDAKSLSLAYLDPGVNLHLIMDLLAVTTIRNEKKHLKVINVNSIPVITLNKRMQLGLLGNKIIDFGYSALDRDKATMAYYMPFGGKRSALLSQVQSSIYTTPNIWRICMSVIATFSLIGNVLGLIALFVCMVAALIAMINLHAMWGTTLVPVILLGLLMYFNIYVLCSSYMCCAWPKFTIFWFFMIIVSWIFGPIFAKDLNRHICTVLTK